MTKWHQRQQNSWIPGEDEKEKTREKDWYRTKIPVFSNFSMRGKSRFFHGFLVKWTNYLGIRCFSSSLLMLPHKFIGCREKLRHLLLLLRKLCSSHIGIVCNVNNITSSPTINPSPLLSFQNHTTNCLWGFLFSLPTIPRTLKFQIRRARRNSRTHHTGWSSLQSCWCWVWQQKLR